MLRMDWDTGFQSELSWKIFLDRYTVKDPSRQFNVGDLVIALVEPHPKWPKKDIGVIKALLEDNYLSIELVTGPQKGEIIERRAAECDRPIETTVRDVARRIARGVASVEQPEMQSDIAERFAREIETFRFVPGGRIWAGAGTGQKLTFFNCYVIPSPKDSRQGIVESLGQMIEIMSRGGGVGINISSLRPQRAVVRGVNGRSSGAVSWMDLFSRATGLVEQGGSRRGALMLQIEDWHPDIWRFIDVKKTPGMVENANISVRISDGFMQTVKQDGSWELVFPDTTDPDYDQVWDGNIETWRSSGHPVVHYETVKARQLWNAIIEGAWQAAEPGIVFDERHEKDSNSWYFNPLISTNPCVTGDTWVATESGYVMARDLEAGMNIRTPQGLKPITKVYNNGRQRIFRVSLSDGGILEGTIEHKLRVRREDQVQWVEFRDLQAGDQVAVVPHPSFGSQKPFPKSTQVGDRPAQSLDDRTLGFFWGMGIASSHDEPDAQWWTVLSRRLASLGIKPEVMLDAREVSFGDTVTIRRTLNLPALQHLFSTSVLPLTADPELLAHRLASMNEAFLSGYLDGLLSMGGDVTHREGRTLICFRLSSDHLAQAVRRTLLQFGVHGIIQSTKGGYEVTVEGQGVSQLAQAVVISHPKKSRQLSEVKTSGQARAWEALVVSVEDTGREEDVFDVHEPDTLSWVTNGFLSFDCAEQPLPAWGVCTLGHINLAAVYDEARHDVDWDALRTTVQMGTRFLDNIVDATPYFFEQNYENQQRERRIGLGTLGLGELLIRLGIRYGSPESIQFIDKLYRFIATEAYLYDVELAKEKGTFPAFDAEKYLQSGFMQRMPEEVRRAIGQYGTRNVTILTQAPTGTVGSMVNTSTGIEPFYALTYYRQSRLGFDEQYVEVAQEWIDEHPDEVLPDYFVGAMDLTPEEHVRVQAAIQRWTDSSISKTANAPSSYTVEDTAKLYELAYDLGCKGVTIYRDQSRQEQVLHLTSTETPSEPEHPDVSANHHQLDVEVYPLPAQVDGRTFRKETPAGTARVVINEVDGSPFEVFMLLGRAGSEIQSFMEALGRIISLYLRTNGNLPARRRLELVADQLKGIGGANQMGFGPGRVLSVVDGIGKLLEGYLEQERGREEVAPRAAEPQVVGEPRRKVPQPTYDLCPQCDAPSLIYEEGCQHCTACGYSKC